VATAKAEITRIIQKFNKEGIEYLVIGGIAVALYGAEKATFDLDLLLSADEKVVRKALGAASSLGYKKVCDERGQSLGALSLILMTSMDHTNGET